MGVLKMILFVIFRQVVSILIYQYNFNPQKSSFGKVANYLFFGFVCDWDLEQPHKLPGFYNFPFKDGMNVNKSINVCTCRSLSKYNEAFRYNTEDSCITRTPADSDTLDLSACHRNVTDGCYDGIQDLYYVKFYIIYILEVRQATLAFI